jgi:biopolymer transport protein ExbB
MSQFVRTLGIIVSAAMVMAMMFIAPVFAQDDQSTLPEENAETASAGDEREIETNGETAFLEEAFDPRENLLVEVDWIEEMREGGLTMICLGLLSVGLVAFLIERFLTLRRKNFLPPGLLTEVRPLFSEGRFDEILEICQKRKSVMADIITHCVNFRTTHFDIVAAGAADIGARAVIDQEEKCTPLTVIAGVAPLLGLLGTMIGMIEAFKLVEVFGDEGGASLLAGSISKALITTAVGLILAIPAILGFHWARRRVHQVSNVIETETEDLLKLWFLSKKETPKN